MIHHWIKLKLLNGDKINHIAINIKQELKDNLLEISANKSEDH